MRFQQLALIVLGLCLVSQIEAAKGKRNRKLLASSNLVPGGQPSSDKSLDVSDWSVSLGWGPAKISFGSSPDTANSSTPITTLPNVANWGVSIGWGKFSLSFGSLNELLSKKPSSQPSSPNTVPGSGSGISYQSINDLIVKLVKINTQLAQLTANPAPPSTKSSTSGQSNAPGYLSLSPAVQYESDWWWVAVAALLLRDNEAPASNKPANDSPAPGPVSPTPLQPIIRESVAGRTVDINNTNGNGNKIDNAVANGNAASNGNTYTKNNKNKKYRFYEGKSKRF